MSDTQVTNLWLDPRNIISICSLAIGVFGALSYFWNRRESRLSTLSKILNPMVRCAQNLHDACDSRKSLIQLSSSFPDPQKAPDAVQNMNLLRKRYEELMATSHVTYREMEAELSANSFRFPDSIAKLLKQTQVSISKYANTVGRGSIDKADILFAKFRDDYLEVTRNARGWRLADPIEGVKKHIFRKKRDIPIKPKYDLDQHQMNGVLELVHKRLTGQLGRSFAIHPPQNLLQNPAIADAENVIEELEGKNFRIVFQDGTNKTLSLSELIVFIFNLVTVAIEGENIARAYGPDSTSLVNQIELKLTFSVQELMRPQMVKALLHKVAFSPPASDAPTENIANMGTSEPTIMKTISEDANKDQADK